MQFLGRPLLLGLPQMTGDGDGVHASGHGFGWDLAELLPVRVVLVQALDHLGGDAPRPDAGQLGDLLRLGAVGVHRPELAPSVAEQHQEVVGFRFLHFLQKNTEKCHCFVQRILLKGDILCSLSDIFAYRIDVHALMLKAEIRER